MNDNTMDSDYNDVAILQLDQIMYLYFFFYYETITRQIILKVFFCETLAIGSSFKKIVGPMTTFIQIQHRGPVFQANGFWKLFNPCYSFSPKIMNLKMEFDLQKL